VSFIARWAGWCDNCKDWFPEGTDVRYNDAHKVRHNKRCTNKDPDSDTEPGTHTETILEKHLDEFGRKPTNVCGQCFTIHAGEC
jgi:hypothetical protein